MDPNRERVRRLAEESIADHDATGWFERVYAEADGESSVVPWADMSPNHNLIAWLDREAVSGTGKKALVVGCGLGDDAEELSKRGFDVTAFDIAPTAVEWCGRRFEGSTTRYTVADLLDPPRSWAAAFDFVLESYTLQALPDELRKTAVRNVRGFIAPGGALLVICRGRGQEDPPGKIPWPLLRTELDQFVELGLSEHRFEDYLDEKDPETRRFRIEYRAS